MVMKVREVVQRPRDAVVHPDNLVPIFQEAIREM